jgi:hypothetical protein
VNSASTSCWSTAARQRARARLGPIGCVEASLNTRDASCQDVEFNPPLRGADGTTMKTNRSSARAWSTRLCLPLVASSVLWAAACFSAGNAASSETASSETPTGPSPTGTASPAEDGFVGLVYVNQEAGYTFHIQTTGSSSRGREQAASSSTPRRATLEAVPRT